MKRTSCFCQFDAKHSFDTFCLGERKKEYLRLSHVEHIRMSHISQESVWMRHDTYAFFTDSDIDKHEDIDVYMNFDLGIDTVYVYTYQ